MAAADKWLDGYFYWRSQYSVRNSHFRDMLTHYRLRKAELARESGDYDAWIKHLGGIRTTCPDKYEKNYDKSFLVKPNQYRELCGIFENILVNFPYTTKPDSPIKMLDKIVSGEFPPAIGRWSGDVDTLVPGARSLSVFPRGKSEDGLYLFAIDFNSETNYILSELRELIEERKNLVPEISDFVSYKPEEIVSLKNELVKSGSCYRTNSNESRAVGLLMFDHAKKSGDSDASTYRWVKNELAELGPKNFGKAKSGERQYQRWLANTRLCIEAAEVLEI